MLFNLGGDGSEVGLAIPGVAGGVGREETLTGVGDVMVEATGGLRVDGLRGVGAEDVVGVADV